MCGATLKKGSYKLDSYTVERELLIFPSNNRVKKIVAFSIIRVSDFKIILPILNEFLINDTLNYFSIQISISKKSEEFVILCFEGYDLNRISESASSINHKISETHLPIYFLQKKELEKQFFNLGFAHLDSKIHQLKSTDSIIIENVRNFNLLDIYTLDLEDLENKHNILYEFPNLIKKFNREGYLIFNFKINLKDMIVSSGYFIDIKNEIKDEFNLEYEINNFFECGLVEPFKMEINNIYKVLWRLEISDNYFISKHIEDIFVSRDYRLTHRDILKINLEFEKSLESNGIPFERLNPKTVFVDFRIIFILLEKVDFKLISKIFDKIYPKYAIYILVADDHEYSKIKKTKKLTDLPNVKIFNYNAFQNLDFQILKSDK